MTPRGGTPQLTFRVGRLAPELDARVGTSPEQGRVAQTRAQVAQRDLSRYYDLLRLGREQIARRHALNVEAAITNPDSPTSIRWVKSLTLVEQFAINDLRERYEAAETDEQRAAILQELTDPAAGDGPAPNQGVVAMTTQIADRDDHRGLTRQADTTTTEAPMYLTIRSDRVTDERVRALLEVGEYLDNDALDMIEREGEVVSDPEAYLTVAGVDGWYLDEDGHSHYVPAPDDPELARPTTQIATVTITEDVQAGGNVLHAGTYRVEMPADYDPALVTGEDILMDDAITIVEQVC